jgi:glyceraldehyde-3-phosphate dehydrogenase [NAD(P)+]
MYEFGPYIDRQWHETGEKVVIEDRAADGICARIQTADARLAREAVAASKEAQTAMRETTAVQRAEWLAAVAATIESRSEELAETIVREAGKPINGAQSEVSSAAERFRRAADEARSLTANFGGYREGSTAGHEGWEAILKPEPVGSVLCISPYNYPLATAALQIAPALAAGNCVVIKPSTKTPVSAALLTEILVSKLDLPEGAISYVPGRAEDIGDALAGDARIDTIAMTGSSKAGERIARESGITTLHMELGGNAPAIVFSDADLEKAAADCAAGSFKYAGQRCSAVSRVLVDETVHDDFVARLESEMTDWRTGDLFDEATTVGPLISPDHAEWVESLVEDAVDRGAQLVRGGSRNGALFEPTLLASTPRDAAIMAEEQFGPVCVVTPFDTGEDAARVANGSDLQLDAAVYTSDYDRALSTADALRTGSVRINGAPSHGIGDVPYGGNGRSGIGREGIDVTVESMLQTKTIIL